MDKGEKNYITRKSKGDLSVRKCEGKQYLNCTVGIQSTSSPCYFTLNQALNIWYVQMAHAAAHA